MNVLLNLYLAVLFVALVPGVLVTLPPKCSKYVVLAVHAVLFALIWQFTHKTVWRMSMEGFQNNYVNSGNNGVVNNSANANVVNNSGNNAMVNNTGMNNAAVNNSGMNVNVNANVEGFFCPGWKRLLGMC
jgi:hypothetical protein